MNATVTDLKEEKKSLHLPSVIEYLNGKGECVRVREREIQGCVTLPFEWVNWRVKMVCMCVCMCVCESESERETVRESETECLNVRLFKRRQR